jgi:phenylacetate-CoA ligase
MNEKSLIALARRACFVGYYRATGRGAILDDVERFERLHFSSRKELDANSAEQVATILRHAAATVPYYSQRLGDTQISEGNALAVLQQLPILTKDIIRKEGQNLVSTRPGRKIRPNTSGGSTGEPIRLLQDERMARLSRSGELLFMRWTGHNPGEPHLLIWGVPRETLGQGISNRERLFRFVCNETYLNCHHSSSSMMDGWILELQRLRPTLIEAYVDALHELSRRILASGKTVPSPRAIITSAGVLTPDARRDITAAFRAPIFNRYGSREVSNVACSCCKNTELHVHEPWCYLEIVDENGVECPVGVEGDILVTMFHNLTMPLIRYRIEDRGVWASSTPCACGRNTRRLAAIGGRVRDYVFTSEGAKIHGAALTMLMFNLEYLKRFQFHQNKGGDVCLRVVPTLLAQEAALRTSLEGPLSTLRGMLGKQKVSLEIVDEIIPSKSGKLRYVINEALG